MTLPSAFFPMFSQVSTLKINQSNAPTIYNLYVYIYIQEAGKTQYVKGALWDIGIVFRSSLYRFTVFGACRYDMVLHKSEI